jgi:hypothetical protein
MNSRERLLTAISGGKPDHVPLLFWCFGFPAPPGLAWRRDGREVAHWYTGRLEHIHTLPERWVLPRTLQLTPCFGGSTIRPQVRCATRCALRRRR